MYALLPVKTFKLRAAGLVFELHHRYDYIRQQCADYIVPDDTPADLTMEARPEYFERTLELWRKYTPEEVDEHLLHEQVEFTCVPVTAYARLPDYDAFWLHATVVAYQGEAYAFTAMSGYGKTTHARLWLEAFGDKAQIINGDAPIIRCIDGVFYASGTPFCGKERYQSNIMLPLKGICYLTHSAENSIRRMDPGLAFAQLFHDNPMKQTNTEGHLAIYNRLVEHVPVYQLYCNMEPEAARVAWAGMQCQAGTEK